MKKYFFIFLSPLCFAADFIGLGEQGSSGTFKNKVTIYIHQNDIQPECLGCFKIRFIYDGYADNAPYGTSYINSVVIQPSINHTNQPQGLYPISHDRNSPRSLNFVINTYIGSTENMGDVDMNISLWGLRCLNPTMPECNRQELKEAYTIKAQEFFNLNPINYDYPNR